MAEHPDTPNEKGLTKQQYEVQDARLNRRFNRFLFGGMVLTALGGLTSVLWHHSETSLPEPPKGYQTYVDAQATVSSLEKLSDTPNPLDSAYLPYKGEELRESLGPDFDYSLDQSQNLGGKISGIEGEITGMEQENPEYITYGEEEKLSGAKPAKYYLPLAPGMAMLFLSIPICLRGERRRGSNIWRETDEEAKPPAAA